MPAYDVICTNPVRGPWFWSNNKAEAEAVRDALNRFAARGVGGAEQPTPGYVAHRRDCSEFRQCPVCAGQPTPEGP